jgi:predicted transposase/invertase (TIGR01784 family)
MAELRNLHDRLFKETFSSHDVAADFLRHFLPAETVALLNLAHLELRKDSFIDPDLHNHFSDLLYEVRLHDDATAPAFVYLLFEHKSYPEPRIALQLLLYLVQIWERAARERPHEPLPAILPIVVYHGNSTWNISRSFSDLLVLPPPFVPHTPVFEYSLCDLTAWSDEAIIQMKVAVFLRLTFLLLKNHAHPHLPLRLRDYLALLSGLTDNRSAVQYMQTVLRYLTSAATTLSRRDLLSAVNQALASTGDSAMRTIAQEWIEEGFEKGEIHSLQDSIRQGLEIKFGDASLRLMERLELAHSNNTELLRAFHAALFRYSTIAELETAYQDIRASTTSADS